MKISMSSAVAITLAGVFPGINADVVLEDFSNPMHKWEIVTDNMLTAGSSTASLKPNAGGYSSFSGSINYQPMFGEPGFAKIMSIDKFPSISNCEAIEITLSCASRCGGVYVAFADTTPNPLMPFMLNWRSSVSAYWISDYPDGITIPFSEFGDVWDFSTGRVLTTCEEDPRICPSKWDLMGIKFLEVWVQGVLGPFDVDLYSIKASAAAEPVNPAMALPAQSRHQHGKA
eukprot:CAMPEP_0198118286 /NCGR_PEP_ID=MMETSP1442-20131203/21033_1 /TAXON_ID= /ORGANISM="Craspedostauros australis, Strain CCMP3328" /LENGTH=229 /DNA_ID=CAMNT_0043776513 /DNA_START=53 /DNA_END=743 /DNA_ORIENTATION=-